MLFPNLPVINKLSKEVDYIKHDFNDWHIISVQHLMETTGSLFEAFINIGFKPENILLTGKIYSTHKGTVEKLKVLNVKIVDSTIPKELGYYAESLETDIATMWALLTPQLKPTSKIIILDDGGYTLKSVPDSILNNYQIFGIEQTTSGIRMQNAFGRFPVIHLAASAAKVLIEPPIVSEAINIQLGKTIKDIAPRKIGIVGYGHIGKAVTTEFRGKYQILVYDINDEVKGKKLADVQYCDSLDELFERSDIIIGATGQDISDLSWLTRPTGEKTLISVSSGDVEFNNLLKNCRPYLTDKLKDPLQVLNLKTDNGGLLKILRGGLVANFTGMPDSSPGHIIQVTRGLLFSAIVQILQDYEKLKLISGPIMLNPSFQSEIVKLWFNDQPQRRIDYSKEYLDGFQNIEWIKSYSAGLFIE